MKNKFIADMIKLEKFRVDIKRHVAELEKVGFTPDAGIFDCLFRVFENSLEIIAARYDIPTEAIYWFVYENEFGKNGRECQSEDSGFVKITDIESFWEFEKRSYEIIHNNPADEPLN